MLANGLMGQLDYLVQMKQAQSSLEEAETAGRLNNYIMLFTLVTIVFVSLAWSLVESSKFNTRRHPFHS